MAKILPFRPRPTAPSTPALPRRLAKESAKLLDRTIRSITQEAAEKPR